MGNPNAAQKQWMKVVGYELSYEVSSCGEIRSIDKYVRSKPKGVEYKRLLKGRLMTPHDNGSGYMYITLSKEGVKKNKYIHRLVAEHFCSGISDLKEVNHIDGNKRNNSSYNLEWVTSKENSKHAYSTGLSSQGSKSSLFFGAIQSELNGFGLVMFGKKQIKESGYCTSSVYGCVNGKQSMHKGFSFTRIPNE